MGVDYSSGSFEQEYTYQKHDLGAVWSPMSTRFRVWAPTAQEVSVHIYAAGTGGEAVYQLDMTPGEKGTWTAEQWGDLKGMYYTYLVLVDGQMQECCDPYARSTGVNGERAMILDLRSTDPEGWDQDRNPHDGEPITEAVIYEAHVRDLTMDKSAPAVCRGQYLGMIESGTTKGGQPTGLRHIQDLGVTHVHLMPVFDFGWTDESQKKPRYNWGYDPVSFNVPEGSYSSNPWDGAARVREMKRMVKGFHDAGISVVMDVVYNHVFDAGTFSFNQLVPGYFSRISADGAYSNGSCCGNDTASERSMVRNYIVDSLNYWADEYHIDGFRFDLVGLLDVQTIRMIMDTVHEKHPGVIFYGEGWTMETFPTKPGTELAVQTNSRLLPGFSFFSDTVRDALRGSVFYHDEPGFITGGWCSKDVLEKCFMGTPDWAAQPEQCVNYVSCHDNNTLFDRITLAAPEAPLETRLRMNLLAAAFVMLSQGVPFLMAGEEILRSKPGKRGGFDHNSYRSGDKVNAVRWSDLDKEENRRACEFYRGLIAFRKAHPGLRQRTRAEVTAGVRSVSIDNDHALAFRVNEGGQELFIAFNADTQSVPILLPEGSWDVHIREETAGCGVLDTVSGVVEVPPISTMVLSRRQPVDVVAALIWEKDRFLICRRPPNKARGLLWEFVGGKVEPGEGLREALIREVREELDVKVEVREEFVHVVHNYPDMTIRLTLFNCVIPDGFPKLLEHVDLKWIRPTQTGNYEFCPADAEIAKLIQQRYGDLAPL